MTRLQRVRVEIEVDTNKDTIERRFTMDEAETASEFADRVRAEIVHAVSEALS